MCCPPTFATQFPLIETEKVRASSAQESGLKHFGRRVVPLWLFAREQRWRKMLLMMKMSSLILGGLGRGFWIPSYPFLSLSDLRLNQFSS